MDLRHASQPSRSVIKSLHPHHQQPQIEATKGAGGALQSSVQVATGLPVIYRSELPQTQAVFCISEVLAIPGHWFPPFRDIICLLGSNSCFRSRARCSCVIDQARCSCVIEPSQQAAAVLLPKAPPALAEREIDLICPRAEFVGGVLDLLPT